MSLMSLKPISASWSAVRADTETGTVCMSSARFWAVTMTSSSWAAEVAAAGPSKAADIPNTSGRREKLTLGLFLYILSSRKGALKRAGLIIFIFTEQI